jgi:hypothetical protein
MNAALGPAIAVPLMLIGLVVALKRQFKATGYHAWNYWLVVVMVAVFGTSCADALHVGFDIPYTVSSAFYLVVLAVVFAVGVALVMVGFIAFLAVTRIDVKGDQHATATATGDTTRPAGAGPRARLTANAVKL